MSRFSRDQVKVVIINTQYVETDAISFKSVVQRLTGKDSVVPAETLSAARRPSLKEFSAAAPPVLPRGMSFKDIDWMLKDMPPLDELYRLCAE